jgi:hypothetical protein
MPETRRTNAGFLSNNEAARDRKRTQDLVRHLTSHNKNVFNSANRLCDSCGVSLQKDVWICKKCNTCFCNKCSSDFCQIQKKDFPECPVCRDKLDFEKGFVLIDDKQRVLRYVQTTKAEFEDEEDLVRKIARLFNEDIFYSRKVWNRVKEENHSTLKLLEDKFKDKQAFRRMTTDVMEYKPKAIVHNIPNVVKPTLKQNEEAGLKETKPIDKLDVEWKKGRLNPADQKEYRGTYQDKE